MLETAALRGRGRLNPGRPHSRNRQWNAHETSRADGERWERGGHRGGRGGRGGHRNLTYKANIDTNHTDNNQPAENNNEAEMDDENEHEDEDEQEIIQPQPAEPDTLEEREKFWKKLVQERELERKKAIAEGKMDDPLVPKRLEDAINIVGTCPDMCPRFERYRRERENNLFQWEMIPGTKRVDHSRAVKMYERAVGDKSIPSDIRPPPVLKTTLDYLFHSLLTDNGFTRTYDFIRDRSRAVRNDFTLQHESGLLAIECHDRCARYHILGLHYGRDMQGFSVNMEEQQLMQTLQSLKEYYEDQRGRYESPTELEMRVYHRLIHIRDQKERPDSVPSHITSHPVFRLTTDFRLHVQKKSEPIQKNSKLLVGPEGMEIFGRLVEVLRTEGKRVMIFLVACILERLFGVDTIEDIEEIRGGMQDQDIIDGISDGQYHEEIGEEEPEEEEMGESFIEQEEEYDEEQAEDEEQDIEVQEEGAVGEPSQQTQFNIPPTSVFGQPSASLLTPQPQFTLNSATPSAFSNLTTAASAFSNLTGTASPFGKTSVFGNTKVFGGSSLPSNGSTESTTPLVASTTPATSNFSLALSSKPTLTHFEVPAAVPRLDPNAPTFTPQVQPASSSIFSNPLIPPSLPVASTSNLSSSPISVSDPLPIQQPSLISKSTSSSSTHSLPKILTDMSEPANPSAFTQISRTPPPAPKTLPLSLPPSAAPTPVFPSFSSLSAIPNLLRREPTAEEILSPLWSPSVSRANSLKTFPFVDSARIKADKIQEKQSEPVLVSASPIPQHPTPPSQETKENQEEDEQAAYDKAVKQSDEYTRKQKQRRKSTNHVKSQEIDDKPVLPRKKRPRARQSMEYRPLVTDEDLAKRLQENRNEHERRWATGTFLRSTKGFIQSRLEGKDDMNTKTSLWLSLNPENDGTAIWVERKFDVCHNSGSWYSEWAYSIPLLGSDEEVESPVLIVFECTPLEGIDDEIERKFRVLEDCARLRQIMKALPEKRWRVPSLLVLSWSSGSVQQLGSDFSQMVTSLEKGGILDSYHVLEISSETKDLDSKFLETLQAMSFDITGRLACSLTIEGAFAKFQPLCQDYSGRWLDKCTKFAGFDHAFYARLIQNFIGILQQIDYFVSKLLHTQKRELPPFVPDEVDDTESLYDTTMAWLPLTLLPAADEILTDLQTHRMMEREFPASNFLNQLWHAMSTPGGSPIHIMRADLDSALSNFKQWLDGQDHTLEQAHSMLSRRSPKRRRQSSVVSESTSSVFTTPSISSKRRRLSSSLGQTSVSPPQSREPTPQPTTNGNETEEDRRSVISEEGKSKPAVTISMLRALAREMKGKYGGVS